MREIECTFILDPGHGWLGAPMHLVEELDIKDCFSSCSYFEKRGMAWLEEDCDAGIFVMEAEKAGIKIIPKEHCVEETYIRGLPSYPFGDDKKFKEKWEESREYFSENGGRQ